MSLFSTGLCFLITAIITGLFGYLGYHLFGWNGLQGMWRVVMDVSSILCMIMAALFLFSAWVDRPSDEYRCWSDREGEDEDEGEDMGEDEID